MISYPCKFVTGSYTEVAVDGFGQNLSAFMSFMSSYVVGGYTCWKLENPGTMYNDIGGVGYLNYAMPVYHSIGDPTVGAGINRGNTDIWFALRILRAPQLSTAWTGVMGVARDMEPAAFGDTANNQVWFKNHSYAPNGDQTSSWHPSADGETHNYWGVINPYSFIWHTKRDDGLVNNFTMVTSPYRPFAQSISGVGRISAQTLMAPGVYRFDVDRDLTGSLKVGQPVWLVNQTPDAAILQSVTTEVPIITALTATQITCSPVLNTYADASLVGYDPVPTIHQAASGGIVAGASGNQRCITGVDDSPTTHSFYDSAVTTYLGITEADYDPASYLNYLGTDAMIVETEGDVFRGRDFHKIFAENGQVDGDIMIDQDGLKYMCLPLGSPAGWCFAYGPGDF